MEALDLWEAIEEDYDVLSLTDNPTMNQIRIHKEKKTKKAKAKSCLFVSVSQTIFTRIMALKSAKAIWDYLEKEYVGDERRRSMQVLNLMREFELQRMKESEIVKDYTDKLLGIVNKIRLLGGDFADSRIVEKVLVVVLEKYEASIVSLENTKDLSKITLTEVVHALQAQEQQRLMREDCVVEGALQAKHHDSRTSRKKNFKKNQPASNENGATNQNKGKGKRKNYPPCQHCGKMGHPPFKCWRRPNAKCSKCNQLGHKAVICKSKFHSAQVVEQDEEYRIFVATCFSMASNSECWLIDSGCTNHMTYDKFAFKDLQPIDVLKIKIGNGDYIQAKGKGTISISTSSSAKTYLRCSLCT